MKLKNYYAWVCAIWIILTLIFCLNCINSFVETNLKLGFVFLVLSVAFAFTSGSLFVQAKQKARFNKQITKWDKLLKSAVINEINRPFKEFDVPFPEVKKGDKNDKIVEINFKRD